MTPVQQFYSLGYTTIIAARTANCISQLKIYIRNTSRAITK